MLAKIVVRFGWLDKTLGQLQWAPLVDLVNDFVNRNLGPTEKASFRKYVRCYLYQLERRVNYI